MEIKSVCRTEGCDNENEILTIDIPENFSTDVWCVCGNLNTIKEI